jgi:hypothetical protein
VNACTDANPECNEEASKADQAKGNPTRFRASPQSPHEGVESEKLVKCTSVGLSGRKTIGEETHKGDQGNTKFTDLLNDALRCAIVPCRHDLSVGPLDIEDTTHSLPKIEHEKEKLSSKFNEPDERQPETVRQTM